MHWKRRVERWFLALPAQWKVRVALGVGLTLSNAIGGAVVVVLALLVVPLPAVERETVVQLENFLVAGGYVAVVAVLGSIHAWRTLHPVVIMLRPEEEPDAEQRLDVLRAPRRIFFFQASMWGLAAVVFLFFNARYSWGLAWALFQMILLAGWVTTSQTYLLAERSLRPVARTVLADGFPERAYVPSVRDRAMFGWALGSGVAVLGVILVGVAALRRPDDFSLERLGVTVIVVGGIALGVGFLTSLSTAQASHEPIASLRGAVGKVEGGDLDVRVPIYDGTEIGLLQAGFNEMVEGLREREQLRDVFGRHVGAEVAKQALADGAKLGGEVREVAVLFVDIVGSTTLAEERDPEDVVALLNRFFEIVIDVVHEHEGWINKFEGDAALAIWGAPTSPDDLRTKALAAARVMAQRLRDELGELEAGIGLSYGPAVAGNIGASERYEYTVIGDPVNEAARLTEEAKSLDAHVAASWAVVEGAGEGETARWRELEPLTLRGRSQETRVATVG